MEIIIGDIPLVPKNPSKANYQLPANIKNRRGRRKDKQDRRESVREGIFVSLTGRNDRRVLRDRRKKNY